MTSKLAEDPRIDPRLKAVFGGMKVLVLGNVRSHEDLLQRCSTPSTMKRSHHPVHSS